MASKDTDLAEAAQALFCALVDFVGINNMDKVLDENSSYVMFKEKWQTNKLTKNVSIEDIYNKHVVAGRTTFKDIENFLSYGQSVKLADSWFKSSVLIAKKLIKDIDDISGKFSYIKTSSWKKIIYAHQDNIIMNNIQTLFIEANKNQKLLKTEGSKGQIPFGDINKWSPADIYLASPEAQKIISNKVKERKGLTFLGKNGLNNLISELIKNGQLLPLSLKKSDGQVNIVKVNFNRATEERIINKVSYGGVKPETFKKWVDPEITNQRPAARDIKIYLSVDKTDYVFLRYDPSGDYGGGFRGEIQVKGAIAKAGGLGEGQIIQILKLCDTKSTSFGTKFENTLQKAKDNFSKKKKPLREMFIKRGKTNKDRDEWYEPSITKLSAEITNTVFPLLYDFLSDKNRADSFTRWVFQYATSRQINSSKFVIAK
jgi:hypothetical protein